VMDVFLVHGGGLVAGQFHPQSLNKSSPSASVSHNGRNSSSTLTKLTRKTGNCPAAARARSAASSALASTKAAISWAAVYSVWLCNTSLLRNWRLSSR